MIADNPDHLLLKALFEFALPKYLKTVKHIVPAYMLKLAVLHDKREFFKELMVNEVDLLQQQLPESLDRVYLEYKSNWPSFEN